MKIILKSIRWDAPPRDPGSKFEPYLVVEYRHIDDDGPPETMASFYRMPKTSKRAPEIWEPNLELVPDFHGNVEIKIALIEDDSRMRRILKVLQLVAGEAVPFAPASVRAVADLALGHGKSWLGKIGEDDLLQRWEFDAHPTDEPGTFHLDNNNGKITAKHAAPYVSMWLD